MKVNIELKENLSLQMEVDTFENISQSDCLSSQRPESDDPEDLVMSFGVVD